MKRNLLTLLIILFFFSFKGFASNSDLFNYDKEEIESAFKELKELEDYVKINDGVTLSDLLASNNQLVTNLYLGDPFSTNIFFDEPPLGIPSFWWGCCIGVWGVAIVYFVTEDKEEVKLAFKGCVIGTLVGVVLYAGVYVWILGNAALWY